MLVEPIKTESPSAVQPLPPAAPPEEREVTRKGKEEEVKAQEAPEASDFTELVENVQENLNMIHNVDLQFSIHEPSGQMVVKVTDGSTGEVIREIPSEEILNLADRLDEMIGLIFDQMG